MSAAEKIHLRRSSIFDLPTNIMAMLTYLLSAGIAWIPYVGYFAWILPFLVFVFERSSNFVRFSAAQAFSLGIIRLVIDLVFDCIRIIARQSVTMYGQDPAFAEFWGSMATPGLGAILIGALFSAILTGFALYACYKAYRRQITRFPLLSELAEYMTRELKPAQKSDK